ncbi:MAG: DUF2062 domain-containing protein [Candidatus Omnitrophica bacterium]|nr:DUF2062 domain-containing protein [Candidatus Omnitrophota bacterium]MBU1048126.1 DUF2062 domain-containing protein [Candidatus Omnitrophota bacterium]MBU1630721.1 DUF2062 domain-containing protein [Candidatus Omnitrophota bacterium]MBU1766659.1 DUF2062 domain-containing protein [Candidatus Omnitrophota bacterium]MBU1889221.1 DUF2062 domain-containing protein [Candidatus Omnitrophota bacterium]
MANKKARDLFEKLKKETFSRKSPHEISLGIGFGVFLGVLPLQGFKTAIVALIGVLYKKINLIAIFTASTVFSFIPVVPFVYFFDYWVGAKILSIPVIFTMEFFKHFNVKILGSAVGALFLGGAVVGITFGILSYFLSFYIIKLKQSR